MDEFIAEHRDQYLALWDSLGDGNHQEGYRIWQEIHLGEINEFVDEAARRIFESA